MKKILIILILIQTVFYANSQTLKLERIMKGKDFTGYSPENIYWSFGSDKIYFKWNPEADLISHWYMYDLKAKKIKQININEIKNMSPAYYVFDKTKTKVTYEKNGDIYIFDLKNKKEFRITNTVETESAPSFNAKGDKIIYKKNNNLYSWNIKNGAIVQITNFVRQKQQKQSVSQQEEWLINDRLKLFDVLRYEKRKNKIIDSINENLKPHRPKEIELRSSYIYNLQLSPDERFVTYIRVRQKSGKNTLVPHFVTKNGFVYAQNSRVKVGFPQPEYKLEIFDIQRDTVYALLIDSIDGITDWPAPYKGHEKGNRKLTFSQIKWSDDGQYALLMARSQDNKDRWFMLADMKTGIPQVINRQTDTAWIGGPGISEWWASGNFGWIPQTHKVWFQSEKTGYSHLYVYDCQTHITKQLTNGNWEVYEVYTSEDGKYWYLLTNKDAPGQRQLYRMPINGGKMQKLTDKTGGNEIFFSPDMKYIAIRHSYSNKPWELYLKPNNTKDRTIQITHSTTKQFEAYPWRDPQIVTFTARDSAKVYARIYLPPDSVKNNAAIIFVHGAGYLQNAHKWWSYYFREYMFHNLLADKGFTILDIDYRGSEGYGRDWRTAIYRHMGGKDLDDQVDGARFLIKNYNIDSNRIGIYGGSYGGFITLMAMFKYPEVFCCGAALRAVTNWANYNHGYTSNILNVPIYDSVAYRVSSPIYYAEGLIGKLLILHGMIDDNVQYQDVVDLTQRLIELHKTSWEITGYPMERHGFKHASSWYDEYRRIYEFFMENLTE